MKSLGWAVIILNLVIVVWLSLLTVNYARYRNDCSLRECRVEDALQETKSLNNNTIRFFNAKGYKIKRP